MEASSPPKNMITHFRKKKSVEEHSLPDIKGSDINLDDFLDVQVEVEESQVDCSLDKSKIKKEMYVSCDICGSIIKYKKNLKKHLDLNHPRKDITNADSHRINENNEFCCKHCNKSFKSPKRFQKHALQIHKENIFVEIPKPIFKCNVCEETFSKKGNLKRHQENLDDFSNIQACVDDSQDDCSLDNTSDIAAKAVECKYCNTTFKYTHGLKSHVRKYHQVKSIDESTEDNKHYVQMKKGGKDVFVCQYCDRKFKKEGFIQKHMRSIHPGKMVVEEEIGLKYCDICGQPFPNVKKLRMHKHNVHNNTKRYTCNICDKIFTMKFNLKKHIKLFHPDFEGIDHVWSEKELHSDTDDIEKYETEHKIIKSNEPHIRMINNNKDSTSAKNAVKCQICSRILSERSALKRHMEEVHSVVVTKRPKPLKCWEADCNAAFDTLNRLRQHLMNTEDDGGHNWIIEEEENVFDTFEEFSEWKADVEENESLRYITLSSAAKREDGSYRKVYHCSRSGKYSGIGTGKRRIKIQTNGTSKIGHFCPSSMNVQCNSLGVVTCTYFKTHYGHDTSVNAIMHVPIHKRDKQFIIEQVVQGVDSKKILNDLHAKGGRSAFIKLKDIKNQIMIHGITEPPLSSQKNYEIHLPNIKTQEKVEVIDYDYNYENEYNYEVGEPDSLVSDNDDSGNMLSETQTIFRIEAQNHQVKVIDTAVHIYQEDNVNE